MSIELLRDLLKDIMARDLLSLDMVIPLASATITEVPREFKDMATEVITRDLLSLVMVIIMDMDNLMFTRTVIIIMDPMDMRLIMITRRDLLKPNPVMDTEDTAMFTELLRDLLEAIMARDLLSLDMVISMDMDNLMSTRTVIIITDRMDMRLIMIIRRDLLLLNQVMDMEDTAMSTELLRDLLKDIMARDLLSLDTATAPELAITTEIPRESKDMAMEVITRDLLSLVMVIIMDMDTLMFTRTVIIIMDRMVMRLIMIIRRDLLRLDMKERVTSMSTGLTLTTQLRYTIQKLITATIKQYAEIVPQGFSFVLVKEIVHIK